MILTRLLYSLECYSIAVDDHKHFWDQRGQRNLVNDDKELNILTLSSSVLLLLYNLVILAIKGDKDKRFIIKDK